MSRALRCTALLAALTLAPPLSAETLSFCYDPYPPYTLGTEGTPDGGLKVVLLEKVMERIAGVEAVVTLLPWKRCQAQVRAGQLDGILPLYPNEERAEYMVFSEPTFAQSAHFWFSRDRFPGGLVWDGDFEAVSHLRLGMLNGSYIDGAMETAFEGGLGITRARDVPTLLQLLTLGRVDLIAIDGAVGRFAVAQASLAEAFGSVERPISVRYSKFGLSRTTGAAQHLPAFNDAIRALAADGTIEEILQTREFQPKDRR